MRTLTQPSHLVLSRLTSKFQATIPLKIRQLLGLKNGDRVAFSVNRDKSVSLRKATPLDIDFAKSLESTLEEWNSPNDEEAYRDL